MKSFKASELFRKTYFQIKVNKSGSVIISDLGESRGNRSSWGSFLCMLFPYFVYIAHFTWTLFSHGKIKSGRKSLVKRKKEIMKKQAPSPKPKAELSISERPIREAKNPSAKWPGGHKSNAESKHIYCSFISIHYKLNLPRAIASTGTPLELGMKKLS